MNIWITTGTNVLLVPSTATSYVQNDYSAYSANSTDSLNWITIATTWTNKVKILDINVSNTWISPASINTITSWFADDPSFNISNVWTNLWINDIIVSVVHESWLVVVITISITVNEPF